MKAFLVLLQKPKNASFFSIDLKRDTPLIFCQWSLHFRFPLACCLIPLTLTPPLPEPTPHPTEKLVGPRSPVDVLASPCTSVSHPAPISKRHVLLSPCVYVLHSSVCMPYYIMWTLLSVPLPYYLPFSHLHCLSLRPGLPLFATLLSLLQEDRNMPGCPPKHAKPPPLLKI